MSSDGLSIQLRRLSKAWDIETENIKVFLRIRPFIEREDGGLVEPPNMRRSCLQIVPSADPPSPLSPPSSASIATTVLMGAPGAAKPDAFVYDYVAGQEVGQEEMFKIVARPVTDSCLQGYNGTIFAYGQTGSGKTFTMQGAMNGEAECEAIDYERRGIIPRTFEYLFGRIAQEEQQVSRSIMSISNVLDHPQNEGKVEYLCKCSYVEIYNEAIYDLLEPSSAVCSLREDAKHRIYIEGNVEEVVSSPADAFRVFEKGARNRHVASTSMNHESSRSHSVFTLFIQSKKREGELVDVIESRFNLVDLAGSERQQLTGTTGARLKEAGNINRSLLALSHVINALVELANGRARHVHYRDSKLTFLLRDSLGGNAKTSIVANVSPSPLCAGETLSTLRFAQRAKLIRNKAVVNKDVQGSLQMLQAEIRRLQNELLLSQAKKMNVLDREDADALEDDDSKRRLLKMFRMAMEQKLASDAQVRTLQEQIALQNELLCRKEQQIKSEKLVIKFRDNHIRLMNKNALGVDDLDTENALLKAELEVTKKQFEQHPEVTRFAFENVQLRERLRLLESYARDLAEHQMELQKHREFAQMLAAQLLESAAKDEEQSIGLSAGDEALQRVEELENVLAEREELIEKLSTRLATPPPSPVDDNLKEVEGLREHIKDLEERLEHAEKKRQRMENEQLQIERERAAELASQLEQLVLEKKELESQTAELLCENKALVQSIRDLEATLSAERGNVTRLEQTLAETKLAFDGQLGRIENELRERTAKLEEMMQAFEQVSMRKDYVEKELDDLQRSANAYEQDYRAAEATVASLQSSLDGGKGEIERLEREVRVLTEKIEEARTRGIEAASEESEQRQKTMARENQDLALHISKLAFMLQNAQEDNEELLRQVESSNGPAASSELAHAKATIESLQKELESAAAELARLRAEHDKLVRHQNLKQKLQYHVRIKQENNELREEIRGVKDELGRLARRNEELEDAMKGLKRGIEPKVFAQSNK